MKRILVLLSVLVAVAACTSPTENTNSVATVNSNTASKPAPVPLTEADAVAKERAAWDAIKNKQFDAFAAMLTSDQIFVGPREVLDKEGTVKGVKDFEQLDVTFSDWKFLPIGTDAFVVTYTATSKVKMNGKEMPPETTRHSSAWVNRDGKWTSSYHQECAVKKPVPPPPAPKTAASPATTSTPLTTSSDVEANEKAIWDALKNKNYDAFASALAPESIEVEPDGVFDKASSVKTVSQFDFSKATLSDFKTVRLNSDASLVTYLSKIPGVAPNGERHSTIWANRSGKWLAMFHQGTPVETGPPPAPPPKAGSSPAAAKTPAK